MADFIEQLRKRQEAKTSATVAEVAKPTEEMTDAQLEEAITESRRQLLDAQHAELRERETARASTPPSSEPEPSLADVLREKQRGKRRTWR